MNMVMRLVKKLRTWWLVNVLKRPVAGVRIEAGTVVYKGDDGKLYPMTTPAQPAGISLATAKKGEFAQLLTQGVISLPAAELPNLPDYFVKPKEEAAQVPTPFIEWGQSKALADIILSVCREDEPEFLWDITYRKRMRPVPADARAYATNRFRELQTVLGIEPSGPKHDLDALWMLEDMLWERLSFEERREWLLEVQ